MTAQDIINLSRSMLMDTIVPYKFDSNLLLTYLNEAQQQAARRSTFITDDTTVNDGATVPLPLCRVTLVASTATYTISPMVLYVINATHPSVTIPLEQKTVEDMDAQWYGWRSATADYPTYFIARKGQITFVPTPLQVATVSLKVARLPVTLTLAATPEIPEMYHGALAYWVCRQAYRHIDQELYDPKMVADFDAQFAATFGPMPTAFAEDFRSKNPKNLSMRARTFGF